MRDDFEVFCLQMTDETTLVGQAFATDPVMKKQCQSFLCQEGYDSKAVDGFENGDQKRAH